MATLITSDGRNFSVDQAFVDACSTLKMIQDDTDGTIPLTTIPSETLGIILKGTVPEFEDPREVFPLMEALDFLGNEILLDDYARRVAESLKGLPPAKVREIFGMPANN